MELTPLTAICPIDGRYWNDISSLSPHASEFGLIQQRTRVEVEYLLSLQNEGLVTFTDAERAALRSAYRDMSQADATRIKDIETVGVPGINYGKRTNHDVKALELYLRDKFKGTGLEDRLELIHFCLTSEDVNNMAYSLMFHNAVNNNVLPALYALEDELLEMCEIHTSTPMPGRTHGQIAIPTTVGKELGVFAYRIGEQVHDLKRMKQRAKLNGAIGNYSAFYAAHPHVDWQSFSRNFVESFGMEHSKYTTQIEPHDRWVDMFHKIAHINSILLGTDQDMWGYISDNYFVQKREEGSVGSSTMPQKVNPIKYENSEAHLGISNALLNYFASKLPISRFQRDLSDSATSRYIGLALGLSILAYDNARKGLSMCAVNHEALHKELDDHWEVLAEPIQLILRRERVPGAYDLLRRETQGRKWSYGDIQSFADHLDIREEVREEIGNLSPHTYTGLGEQLARSMIQETRELLQ